MAFTDENFEDVAAYMKFRVDSRLSKASQNAIENFDVKLMRAFLRTDAVCLAFRDACENAIKSDDLAFMKMILSEALEADKNY